MFKYQKLIPAEDLDESEKATLVSRLDRYDSEFIHKGEDIISLHFCLDEKPTAIQFAHQIFAHGLHCGFRGLSISLYFDASWNCVDSKEVHSNDQAPFAEVSALQQIQSHPSLSYLFQSFSSLDFSVFPVIRAVSSYDLVFIDSPVTSCPELFHRCLAMSTFFVERASQVENFNSFWKLVVVVDKKSNNLCGFCTLFEFRNPVRETSSWRICTLLVLPSHQRQGLAFALIESVYRQAWLRAEVKEVTVEDPCEGFSKVRRRVEFYLCEEKHVFSNQGVEKDSKVWADTAMDMKFPKTQMELCFLAHWRRWLLTHTDEEETKIFRLKVKGILKRDLIHDLPDARRFPAEFKARLQQEYEFIEKQLDAMLLSK